MENRNGRKLFATLLPDAIFNVEQFYDVEEFFHLQTQGGAIQFLRSSAKQKNSLKKTQGNEIGIAIFGYNISILFITFCQNMLCDETICVYV